MADYSVKVQNRFAFLLESPVSVPKPAKSKKKKTPANKASSESKDAKAATPQCPEKAPSSHSANVPSETPAAKESTKREPAEVNHSHNNSKVNHQQPPQQQNHSEAPVESNNNSFSGKPGSSYNNRNGLGSNRNNNRPPQNERRFDGNDRSNNYSHNNSNNNRNQRGRDANSDSAKEFASNDVASAVFSNNAPIPQWEDFSASNNNTKSDNKNDHQSNGFLRDEFPQVEEFRPDNLEPKNQDNDGSNRRNAGFGNSRARGGNFGGRGSRGGGFRGRTFSRGGGGGFGGNFRNDRGPPPNYEGGENNFHEVDNNQEYGNENAAGVGSGGYGGRGGGGGGFYGNRRGNGNFYPSRFQGGGERDGGERGGRGGSYSRGGRGFNNYRQSSNNYFERRRPFDRPPRENTDGENNNEQERASEQNGGGFFTAQHQNATDGEQATNGAEINGTGGFEQKNPMNGEAAPPQEEIGDWNAEVEKEEARRKENGEPAPGASEETAFMSLEDFEAAQREKQRNTSLREQRKPGEGVNQFEGMRKLNSGKANESSITAIPNNQQLSSEPGTQPNKTNSGRSTKQNKLDIHFGPAPAKSSQTPRGEGGGRERERGGNFGSRGGYNDRGYGGYGGRGGGGGRGSRRGGGGGSGGGSGGPNFSDNRRGSTKYDGPAPTFNSDTDFPILGEN